MNQGGGGLPSAGSQGRGGLPSAGSQGRGGLPSAGSQGGGGLPSAGSQGGGGLPSAGSQGRGGLPSAGESPPPLRSGMRLAGDFTLLRPLGEGGMGAVWLAREDPPGRDVALKAMKPSRSATRLRRFEREAAALAALDHPSILTVLRTGVDPATGIPFLVTRALLLSPAEIVRLCDEVWRCPYPTGFDPGTQGGGGLQSAGGSLSPPRPLTLADLLNDGKALPEAAVLAIARDVADALRAAHAAGVIHRDVKPSNILFDASGRAHLADFGLAKFLDSDSAASPDGRAPSRPERGSGAAEAPDSLSIDESGQRKFLGSPAYAAPETFRAGAPSASPATDWYSFGAVFYEALTGEKPRSLRAPSSYDPDRISKAWDRFLSAHRRPTIRTASPKPGIDSSPRSSIPIPPAVSPIPPRSSAPSTASPAVPPARGTAASSSFFFRSSPQFSPSPRKGEADSSPPSRIREKADSSPPSRMTTAAWSPHPL